MEYRKRITTEETAGEADPVFRIALRALELSV